MTPGNSIGHLAISASAGSGKTFQLAHRYLRLLAQGVSPEEIVALTFSRKAAGEIFDSIVSYLCAAAASDEGGALLGKRIGGQPLTSSTCTALLRKLLESLHRLRVGTLDSFAVGILRSFPLELGIPPAFDLTDSESAPSVEMREKVLNSILIDAGPGTQRPHAFLEYFAQASEGRLGKQVQQRLAAFISAYQAHLRALPVAGRWGAPEAIWPGGTPWLDMPYNADAAAEGLREFLPTMTPSDDARQRWEAFIAAAQHHTVRASWSKELTYLFEKLVGCVGGLRSGAATVKLNRAVCDMPKDVAGHVLALMTHVVRLELNAALTRTRGIHGLLSVYDRQYDAAMRRDGILSFADAQHLLAPAQGEEAGARLSGVEGDSRLYIDYRLDAHLNHWLLDEFQDTSDLQWRVLENLIDEVLQDDSGRRSFFYVGDVKQAIYGWRGGNPRLFDVPLARYPGAITVLPLHESFRSCPAIIEAVNRVFGDLSSAELPPRAIARWQHYWEPHRSTPSLAKVEGFASILEPPCEAGNLTPSPQDRYRVVANLLNEMQPLARGLTTAILVRSNDQGRELVDYLRGSCPGMTIVHEGRAAIKDNPVVAVLLSLVAYAAHPGDLMAWRHLQMSPLRAAIEDLRLDRESLSLHLLHSLEARGFQRTLRDWAGRLDAIEKLDAFGRIRLEQLLAAAGEFDASGVASCDRFLAHIDRYETHDVAADDALRVMTMHQAKGLGFDVVILPELDRDNMVRARGVSFVLSRERETQQPQWALELPRRAVAECDDTLREELEQADADAAFESLCLLYVAMTRAKRGLYLVTSYPGKASKLLNQPALVKERLHGNPKAIETEGSPVTLDGETFTSLYTSGSSRWYQAETVTRAAAAPAATASRDVTFSSSPSERTRLVAVRPSESDALDSSAGALFDRERQERLEMGRAVHSLFERVQWSDGVDVEVLLQEWEAQAGLESRIKARAAAHFRRAMATRPVRSHLSRPGGSVSLWRERHFDIVAGSRWITGSFDRAVIVQDADGSALSATIYDFKTDDVPAAGVVSHAPLYRPQLLLYREALAQILRLPPSRIRMILLFTGPGVAHEVAP
jgi:ATP-dependent helicase/nuclease subunit A